MKIGSIICLALFVLGALISLIQMWFSPLEYDTFIKLLVTLGILIVTVLGVTLVRREYIEDKKLKEDGFID